MGQDYIQPRYNADVGYVRRTEADGLYLLGLVQRTTRELIWLRLKHWEITQIMHNNIFVSKLVGESCTIKDACKLGSISHICTKNL